jgi:hypothetical protein
MSDGYCFALGPCIGCGKIFCFNPIKVPSSSAITGKREPVCAACMNRINTYRVEHDLPPFVIQPDAYEPIPEGDVL